MDESKGRKEFRRGKKNWTLTFSIVLLNNEKFYWTKYFRFTNKFFLKFCVTWEPRNQVQAYFSLFLFLVCEDIDRYWEDTQKLDKNLR